MKNNDNKIIFESPSIKMKKPILLDESNDLLQTENKYFRRKSTDKRKNLNTQPILRKETEEIQQRRQHAKSGFILTRKEIISIEKINEFKTTNSVNSIFKRRVHSESKVVPVSKSVKEENSSNVFNAQQQSKSKINFAKKLIEDLKKATFKMKKGNSRYMTKDNNIHVSKSFDNNNNNNEKINTHTKESREKEMQKSIEKLRPSFNINEVKFYSSKKLLRKSSQESHECYQEKKTVNINSRAKKSRRGEEETHKILEKETYCSKPSNLLNEEMFALEKIIKKSQQPLKTYSEFIKGSKEEIEYRISVNYLLQYSRQEEYRISQKSHLTQIDFSALKLQSSIYSCLVETLNKLLEKVRQYNKNKKKLMIKNDLTIMINEEIEVIKEYIEVYFHTYSRMKAEYIICEVVFYELRKKLYAFFILQRVVFYWLYENINICETEKISSSIQQIIEFIETSEEINKLLLNILHEEMASYNYLVKGNKLQDESKRKEDKIVDTFRTLKLVREMEKRLYKLREIVDSVVMVGEDIDCCFGSEIKNDGNTGEKCTKNSIKDVAISLMSLIEKVEKDENQSSSMLEVYQLEQYFNWTLMNIPPLFYLPPEPSRPYTLVIDLDGTLIYYDEETKILKYRPYMDKFLTSIKKYFELVIFSSHPKERTDIIVQEIERDEQIFEYRLYRQHMVFQEGGLRKNVGYLGRSVQRVILIDDEEKNTEWLPLNSYKIPTFTGDKKDKELLTLCDWLTALIETEPGDIRGKLKQKNTCLDEVLEVDEVSSTIQASIEYCENNETTRSTIKNGNNNKRK